MANPLDPAQIQAIAAEALWLRDNPDFRHRPATLVEFLGPDYLNVRKKTRERVVEVLADIMGHEVSAKAPTAYSRAMFTGAIGIGKTTVASIVLAYLVHWTLCLKDPQEFFGLFPGSRIAFMMMSTKASQAREVLFSDVKELVSRSPWFKAYPIDPAFKNQIRFQGNIWIVPGDSTETAFEGYNILAGIIDEADSHKITETKDYADEGYRAIINRISSRFGDRGFVMIIGQMKSSSGFAARKYREFQEDPKAYTAKLTIWESFGRDFYRDEETGEVEEFWYDTKRKQVITDDVVASIGPQDNMMKIPIMYLTQFRTNPEEALKDLAGIPPTVSSPFISLTDLIVRGRQRWIERYGPIGPVSQDGVIQKAFRAPNTLPRVCHVDIGYSDGGDALGFAMGHIPELVTTDDGEEKPFIVIDLLLRMMAAPGQEIFFGDFRRVIFNLQKERGFKIKAVTLDGFQSVDTIQQLNRKKIPAGYLSMDREKLPYHELREAIYEDRIAYPPYAVNLRPGSTEIVEILPHELEQLVDMGKKVDHPVGGSKDVADAVAGVVCNLMSNTTLHRGRRGSDYGYESDSRQQSPFYQHRIAQPMTMSHPAYTGTGVSMPIPPRFGADR